MLSKLIKAIANIASIRFVALMSVSLCALQPAHALDLTTSEGQFEAYLKMRGDASGKDVVMDWTVTMFAVLPGEKPRPIMRTDGYNIGRMEKQPDGSFHWISREVSYYKDLKSGEILSQWTNPFTNEVVDVLHVANDPVNGKFGAPATTKHQFPWLQHGDIMSMLVSVPLAYPNALQPAEFPKQSSGPMYLASEHFSFFMNVKDLHNPALTTIPAHYTWFRTGPFLPWMNMGGKEGYLIYAGTGSKLAKWDDLAADVKAYTIQHFPQNRTAPASFVTPNVTSWSYYKKIKQAEAAKK